MAHLEEQTAAAPEPAESWGESGGKTAGRNSWATLAACGGAHLLHDGLVSLVYVLLPVWAGAFSLNLVQAAALKVAYVGSMSVFQVPATFLSERLGEGRLLAAGTALAGIAYLLLGWAAGFGSLLLVLLVAGLGSSVQHPLASSLVAGAFGEGRRRTALGIYNFTGDLGKMILPGLAALSLGAFPWPRTTLGVGVLCLLSAAVMPFVLRSLGPPPRPGEPAEGPEDSAGPEISGGPAVAGGAAVSTAAGPDNSAAATTAAGGWGILDPAGFGALSALGVVDGAVRGGFLVLLPFLLIGKGATVELVGLSLILVFAGGACGKFVCGMLAERVGIVRTVWLTELATAAGILAVMAVPLEWEYPLLPLVGLALNGTSSVLYATVADLVMPRRRARAFALFYTVVTGSSATAPLLFAAVGDSAGIPVAFGMMAAAVLLALPLSLRLRV